MVVYVSRWLTRFKSAFMFLNKVNKVATKATKVATKALCPLFPRRRLSFSLHQHRLKVSGGAEANSMSLKSLFRRYHWLFLFCGVSAVPPGYQWSRVTVGPVWGHVYALCNKLPIALMFRCQGCAGRVEVQIHRANCQNASFHSGAVRLKGTSSPLLLWWYNAFQTSLQPQE